MSEKNKKEVVIVGAGPGGYAAAFRAADLGLKVTLVDPEANPGGVCLYRGCIPSKALLHVAKLKQTVAKAENWGLKFKEPKVNAEKLNNWKDEVVEKLTGGLGKLSKSRNINYIKGKARFKSDQELEIEREDGEKTELEFENLILATGSAIMSLPNIEIDHKIVIDSTDALDIKEIPVSLLIIGGGYIGLELGSVYATLGCKVSIAEMTPGFLPGTDRELVAVFEKENEKLFEALYFETKVEEVLVEKEKATVKLANAEGEQEKQYDKVLVAVGRKPNSEGLNLEKAGVNTDDKGFIEVDANRKTSNKNIYAIGDLTGEPLLAHKATYEGKIAAEAIAGQAGAAYDPRSIPGIVFTNPEIAWCGLTEDQAKEKNIEIKVEKYPWTASGKAAMTAAENGLTKLIFHPETGVILGGAVAGKNAGALIAEISLAIEAGATAQEISLAIHPHPNLSETIMEASELFFGGATHINPEMSEKIH